MSRSSWYGSAVFVAEVQVGQRRPRHDERLERLGIRHERDARQVAFEVLGVAAAVFRVVEQGIDVVEDVPLRHRRAVPLPKLPQCPLRDVLPPPAAVLVVRVEREALCIACQVKICNAIRHQTVKSFAAACSTYADHSIFLLYVLLRKTSCRNAWAVNENMRVEV